MRKLLVVLLLLLGLMAVAAPALAAVTNCTGGGVISTLDVQYGRCNTDQNGGTGSVSFSNGGRTATLAAKTQRNAQEVASNWQSNSPVDATGKRVCASVRTDQLVLKGLASVTQQMVLSYDGAVRTVQTFPVTSTGTRQYCTGTVPVGATNAWWQLLTTAGGNKPVSQVKLTQTLTGVTIS